MSDPADAVTSTGTDGLRAELRKPRHLDDMQPSRHIGLAQDGSVIRT
jgi:hypothetical protein